MLSQDKSSPPRGEDEADEVELPIFTPTMDGVNPRPVRSPVGRHDSPLGTQSSPRDSPPARRGFDLPRGLYGNAFNLDDVGMGGTPRAGSHIGSGGGGGGASVGGSTPSPSHPLDIEGVDSEAASQSTQQQQQKAQERERLKYMRKAPDGPPKLSFFDTLLSGLMSFVLTAATTLIIGVPPLFIADEQGRTIYVALMIPVVTVVVTIVSYNVTDFSMRRVSVFLLQLAREMDKRRATFETLVRELNTCEQGYLQELRSGSGTIRAVATDGGRSPSGSSRRLTGGAGSYRAYMSLNANAGISLEQLSLRPISAVEVYPPTSDDPLALVSTAAANITQHKRWITRQLEKVSELGERAVHPEVKAQQRLLKYFLTAFFDLQTLLLTAWGDGVVAPVAERARVTALGGHYGAGSLRFNPNTTVRVPSLSTSPAMRGIFPDGSMHTGGRHPEQQQNEDVMTATTPLTLGSKRNSTTQHQATWPSGGGTTGADDLTCSPQNLQSAPPSGQRADGKPVDLPYFSPLSPPTATTDSSRAGRWGQGATPGTAHDATPPSKVQTKKPSVTQGPSPNSAGELSDIPDVVVSADTSATVSAMQESRPRGEALGMPTPPSSAVVRRVLQSPNPTTITVRRGGRFVGDGPFVFFYVSVHEDAGNTHRRTLSTSTKVPHGGSPLRPGAIDPLSRSSTASTTVYAFEALIAPKSAGGGGGTPLTPNGVDGAPPLFAHDKVTWRPYVPFFADARRRRRRVLTIAEQRQFDFAYCAVEKEQPPSTSNSDGEERPLNQRQDTSTHTPKSPSRPRGPPAAELEGGGASRREEPSSSYVMSWKALVDRPMRLTCLSVCLDDGSGSIALEEGGAATSSGDQSVWLPVLECLIDDILCVVTSAEVTVDHATHQIASVELHGVSIEDLSRGSSQLMSTEASSFFDQGRAASRTDTEKNPSNANSPITIPDASRRNGAIAATNLPSGGSTPLGLHLRKRSIGQTISETVFVSPPASSHENSLV